MAMHHEITQTFEAYAASLAEYDAERVISYIYPKLFSLVPRQMLLGRMKQETSENMPVISNIKLQSISPVLTENGVEYALVDYTFTMQVNHGNESELEMALAFFREIYGDNNVQSNQERLEATIFRETSLYAINDPKFTAGWTFLENKKNQKAFLAKLIPQSVMDQFS